MIGEKKRQPSFVDDVLKLRIPQDHPLVRIKREIDFGFVEEEVKDLYCSDNGRPSYPPALLFKMLFLEFYENLSDVEISQQVLWNGLYQYFLDIGIEDLVPDDTTLSVFRSRLGEERFERLFNRIVKQCQEKGLLKGRLKVVDATHIIADIAIPNTVNLLRQGRRVIIGEIEKGISKEEKREGVREKIDALRKAYWEEGKVYRKPTEEELAKEVKRCGEFVAEVKGKYGEGVDRIVAEMEKILEGNVGNDRVASFIDPDAKFGHKSKEKPFVGYKVHIAEDEGSEIVTSVETLTGEKNEGKELRSLLRKEEEKGIIHEALAADGLYDRVDNRKLVAGKGMEAFIPGRIKEKHLDGKEFRYDSAEDRVICPAGHKSEGKSRQEVGTLHIFPQRFCEDCPFSMKCPPKNEGRVRVFVSDDYVLKIKIDPEKKKEGLKKRKNIERKFGEGKKWHALGRTRYRGRWRVAIQVFMTFIVINVKRMIKLLEIKGRALAPI
jgi:transposase